jgi:hypothetical protein
VVTAPPGAGVERLLADLLSAHCWTAAFARGARVCGPESPEQDVPDLDAQTPLPGARVRAPSGRADPHPPRAGWGHAPTPVFVYTPSLQNLGPAAQPPQGSSPHPSARIGAAQGAARARARLWPKTLTTNSHDQSHRSGAMSLVREPPDRETTTPGTTPAGGAPGPGGPGFDGCWRPARRHNKLYVALTYFY